MDEADVSTGEDLATHRGVALVANTDYSKDNKEGTCSFVSFEYLITSGNKFSVALIGQNWDNYYGYYNFGPSGATNAYKGIYSETLDDGYIKVTFDLSSLDVKTGTPTEVKTLYIRGAWSDVNGYIDNIRFTNVGPDIKVGDPFSANTDYTYQADENVSATTVTFEYLITNSGHINISLFNKADWNHYYGYYEFNKDGSANSYNGVSTVKLDNGYIRVTMVVAELNKTNNNYNRDNAPSLLSALYIRGAWSDANGYIYNIQFNA